MEKHNRNGIHFKRLDREKAAEAVRLYESGLSIGDVAEFFDVSRQSMWDLLRRRTAMRPQKRTEADNHLFSGGPVSERKAQRISELAIEKGILVRPSLCSECGGEGQPYKDGRGAIQAHHDDYNRPLDVRWLCFKCHREWHHTNKPVPGESS